MAKQWNNFIKKSRKKPLKIAKIAIKPPNLVTVFAVEIFTFKSSCFEDILLAFILTIAFKSQIDTKII